MTTVSAGGGAAMRRKTAADNETVPSLASVLRRPLVIAFMALFFAGIASEVMAETILDRFWGHLISRHEGPMSFRFVLQPAMAALAAFHDGRQDARLGRSPYFWTVLSAPGQRQALLREGLGSTGRIIGIGLVMDVVYQIAVFGALYPLEAVVIALTLAFLPYLLLRGPVARIARRLGVRQHPDIGDAT